MKSSSEIKAKIKAKIKEMLVNFDKINETSL
jgi:hypothetical protein